jgi:hypothetical protein
MGLREASLRVLVHGVERQRLRAQGEQEDRLIRGVDLAIARRLRHPVRQPARRSRDRRLHVLSRRIEIAPQVELQGDVGRTERALRAHRVEAVDRRKFGFERRRHRSRHRLGARAGQLCAHLNRRKVDVRQRRDRQLEVRHDPEGEDRDHHEARRDRPADEGAREVHQRLTSGPPAGALLACGGRLHRHHRAVAQPNLAVRHDDVARAEPGAHERELRCRPHELDTPELRLAALDDERVLALLTLGDGRLGRDDRPPIRIEDEHDVDRLTRPELGLFVRERRLEAQRAGGDIDGVLEKRDRSLHDGAGFALRRDFHAEHAGRHALAYFREVLLGHGKPHLNRRKAANHDERLRFTGAHHVARVHEQTARASRERRGNTRERHVQTGARERGTAHLHVRRARLGVGARAIELLRGGETLVRQPFGAARRDLRLLGERLVSLELGLGGGERGAVGPGVDAEKQRALFDEVALLEMHLRHDAGHLRHHVDRARRFHDPERCELERDVLFRYGGDGDRNRARLVVALLRVAPAR